MKQLLLKTFCSFVVFSILFTGVITSVSHAATPQYEPLVEIPKLTTDNGSNPDTGLAGFIQNAYRITIALSISLAIIMFTYHAFMYLVSEASLSSKSAARAGMENAVIGLLLVFSAWLILNTINPDLLKFNLNI